mgnify:CR=1 FL=1
MVELLVLAAVVAAIALQADDEHGDGGEPMPPTHGTIVVEPLWWHSDTAQQQGIDNAPGADAMANLLLLKQQLDATFPGGYGVTNAFRSPALNEALRARGYAAAANSWHLYGRAADVVVVGMSPSEAAAVAKSSNRFIEVIAYPRDGHLHVAI